ncbi:MAG: Rrf2 family transcriptional regulator [Proteobacteria bacterium]|nr:Rrf2 family transcriptional regulator [Pseudomonadota bacterium]
MRVSQRAAYAVGAMLDLALHGARGGVRTAEIAQRTAAPEKFLEAVMRDLQRAGFVSSKRGPDGGHRLLRDAGHLTVGAIVEAIDGPFARPGRGELPPSVERGAAEACLSALWGRLEAAMRAAVESVTLEDLRRQVEGHGALDFVI